MTMTSDRRRPAPPTRGKKPKRTPPAVEAVSRPFASLAVQRSAAAAAARELVSQKTRIAKGAQSGRVASPARNESEDDLAFELHMEGVTPLSGRALRVPATTSAVERRARGRGDPDPDLDADARAELHALVSTALRFEVVDDGALLEGRRLDVDPRELRRLRKQRYPVDGKLDLHGQTTLGAKEAVERFLARRRSQGDRAVLVVHGRGNHSPGGVPVLRGELGAWLSQGAAAKDVLAFASVTDENGESSGAVLVLLAKR